MSSCSGEAYCELLYSVYLYLLPLHKRQISLQLCNIQKQTNYIIKYYSMTKDALETRIPRDNMNSFYYRQPNKILRSVYLFIMFIWLIVAETTVYKCSALGACIGPDERHSDSGTTGRGAPRHQEMSRKRRTRQLHQSLRNGQNRR